MSSPALPREDSSLSSISSDIADHEELESIIRQKLVTYQPVGTTDHTVSILEAFSKCLPRDGAWNIAGDIMGCDSGKSLRELANHLLTAVLIPCEYPLLSIYMLCYLVLHSKSTRQDTDSFAVTTFWDGTMCRGDLVKDRSTLSIEQRATI